MSRSVSPLVRLEVVAEMLMTSALSRKAASSKEMRVRVLGSTKKFTSVLPRRAGTFFTSRVPTCLKAAAVSSTWVSSSAESAWMAIRSFRVQPPFAGPGIWLWRSFLVHPDGVRHLVGFWNRTYTRCAAEVGRFLPM